LESLPQFVEINLVDSKGKRVETNICGFYINAEHFSGDVYAYEPLMKKDDDVNILCLGPAGAGKVNFFS
jgi:hypothetical protein